MAAPCDGLGMRAVECMDTLGLTTGVVLPQVTHVMVYPKNGVVELFHTAALPPDLNVTFPTHTTDPNIFRNQTLDVVCVSCISSGDNILIVNTNDVVAKYGAQATQTRIEIEVSWPHRFCGKQVYQLAFTAALMDLNLTDSKGQMVNKFMAYTNHTITEVPTVVLTSKTSADGFDGLLLVIAVVHAGMVSQSI
jgi:hypothetical protein